MTQGRILFASSAMVFAMLFLLGCPQSNPVGPTAEFSADYTSGIAPLVVQFTDQSLAGDSPITSWSWSFGDGTSSAEPNPTHSFAMYGTYHISLTVITANGTDSEDKQGFITVTPQAGTEVLELLPGNVPMTLVWVPSGTFLMGRSAGETEGTDNEDPQHTVTVQGFWMGKYEVTKGQWQAVMNTTPWSGQTDVSNDLDSPAVYVTWNDAQSFITALNNYTGAAYHLPSEAAWEYACRAGTTTRYYWGEDPTFTQIGNYSWTWVNCNGYSHVVGQKLSNTWNLFDMIGNAGEYCQDVWHNNYTGAPTDGSVWEDVLVNLSHVVRGGGWGSTVNNCRSATRLLADTTTANSFTGFRLAR